MQLIFWDTKIIMINKWVDEIYKKFKNPKVLEKYIREDWQKELMERYKQLKEENKRYKWNKYMLSLNKIKMDNIYDDIMKPILEYRRDYFSKNYNSVVCSKREEYKRDIQKKLNTQREIICPF